LAAPSCFHQRASAYGEPLAMEKTLDTPLIEGDEVVAV
jgi:hypothetical protein